VEVGLARGYMSAQKHCELFGDVLGYVIRYAHIPGTGSWVLCGCSPSA